MIAPLVAPLVAVCDRLVRLLAIVGISALLGAVILGVLSRAWNDPLIWTDELSRFLMVWLACLGWILAGRKRIHIRIRFFQNMLPPRLRHGSEIAMQASVLLLGALIFWFSLILIERNADLEATMMPISMAWMFAPMALAGFATALQGLSEVVELLRGADREGA